MLAVAEGLPLGVAGLLGEADDGALPAVGAEQAVSAATAKRAAAVSGRARFFTVHIPGSVAPPASAACLVRRGAPAVSPGVRV